VADSKGGGGEQGSAPSAAPTDRMHLKTSENFAQKCIIFAKNFRVHPCPSAPPILSGSAAVHIHQHFENADC